MYYVRMYVCMYVLCDDVRMHVCTLYIFNMPEIISGENTVSPLLMHKLYVYTCRRNLDNPLRL